MVITVFRQRVRPDAPPEMFVLAGRMYELASQMPGFISFKEYEAKDGESLSLVEFATIEDSARWREHPEHLAVQRRASELFSEYRVQVCDVKRQAQFP